MGPMKIEISQKEKKLEIVFKDKKFEESFIIAQADEFLACVDRVVKLWQSRQRRLKHRRRPKFYYPVDNWKNAVLEFSNAGLLTERTIRAIMLGLSFKQN